MQQINYIGEHLWVGQLGVFLILLGFVSALLSAVSYLFAIRRQDTKDSESWLKLGRIGFGIHSGGIIGVMALIFYAMAAHMYEYIYVFEHVSDELPMKYILSAFWEGQEGSFLLWMFWHIVLGLILIKYAGKWEKYVLLSIALAELILNSMLLGIYFEFGELSFKIGSNPMLLVRETTVAPIFTNADYLSLIKGRGLNPLLQNYWMTIHPPTLFLGFASTIVPFAYALGGLWSRNHAEWLKPAIKWALFSAAILGLGIFMGSLWAYEALSFGGYWAWDPVENTSLVPWIILVAGIHTNMIANNTGRAVKSTYLFYLFAFILIIYSTLLTRSGILGDTSAHAFTEMGLEWQLTGFLLFFLLLSVVSYVRTSATIPSISKEESLYSREFWMFIGALVLFFSAVLITASSSLPVFNTIYKLFDPNYVGRVIQDPVEHYNKNQHWIAVFISLLAGITIFLRYRESEMLNVRKNRLLFQLFIHFGLSVISAVLLSFWIKYYAWQYWILSIVSFYVIIANADFLIKNIRKDYRLGTAAVSHMGFGLMILGVIGSGLNSSHLSNPFVFRGIFEPGDENKYVQLIKSKPLLLDDHIVTWESDTLIGKARYYTIDFKQVDTSLNVIKQFKTKPNAVYSNDMAKIAAFNPDTKHYLHKDIFTCILALPPAIMDTEVARKTEDTLSYVKTNLYLNDSLVTDEYRIIAQSVSFNPTHPEYRENRHDFGVEISLKLEDMVTGEEFNGVVAIGLEGLLIYKYAWHIDALGLKIRPSEELINQYLSFEDQLEYQDVTIKKNESFNLFGYDFMLKGFTSEVPDKFEIKDGDIAVAGIVEIEKDSKSYKANPVFVIRDSAPMSYKDYIAEEGLHVRLANIDPKTEDFTMKIARDKRVNNAAFIEIASNVPRTDYLILEAKIFPAINWYWLGCIFMLSGLLMATIYKLKSNL
mgnify:CR=1 FL=1